MDVMDQFFRGQQAGRQVVDHEHALEENKLRMAILKHQVDGIKIEDQIRQREMAKAHLGLLEGLPEAEMPMGPAQANLQPSSSVAGGMTGLPGVVSSMIGAEDAGPDAAAAPPAAPAPATMLAPNAQAAGGTNAQPQTVKFGAIPDMGIPEANIRPRTMEEITRAHIAAQANEKQVLSRGQKMVVGGRTIAEGAPEPETRLDVGKRAAAGDAGAKAQLDAAYPNRTAAQRSRARPVKVMLDGQLADVLFDPDATPGQKYTDLDGNVIEDPGKRVRPTAANGSSDPDAAARRDYNLFFKSYDSQHPSPTASERAAYESNKAFNKDAKPPVQPRPAPSFDKWKVMTPEERQAAVTDPDARITDAEMIRRTQAAPKQNDGPAVSASKKASDAKKLSAEEAAGILKGATAGNYVLRDHTTWSVGADGSIQPGRR